MIKKSLLLIVFCLFFNVSSLKCMHSFQPQQTYFNQEKINYFLAHAKAQSVYACFLAAQVQFAQEDNSDGNNFLLTMPKNLDKINYMKSVNGRIDYCFQKRLQEIYKIFFEVNKLLTALGGSVCFQKRDFEVCDKLAPEFYGRFQVNKPVDYEKIEDISLLNGLMLGFLMENFFKVLCPVFFNYGWNKIKFVASFTIFDHLRINVSNLKQAYYQVAENIKTASFEEIYKICFDVDLS